MFLFLATVAISYFNQLYSVFKFTLFSSFALAYPLVSEKEVRWRQPNSVDIAEISGMAADILPFHFH